MDDYYVEEAMINFGGDFVRRLGMLHRVGDPENRARIKAAWPDYWKKYRVMAELKAFGEWKSKCDTRSDDE